MGINYDNGVKMDVEYYAAELATLRSENERLREALGMYADHENWMRECIFDPNSYRFNGVDIAKEALK